MFIFCRDIFDLRKSIIMDTNPWKITWIYFLRKSIIIIVTIMTDINTRRQQGKKDMLILDCKEVEDIKINEFQQLFVLKWVIVYSNSKVFQIGWIVKVISGTRNHELDTL